MSVDKPKALAGPSTEAKPAFVYKPENPVENDGYDLKNPIEKDAYDLRITVETFYRAEEDSVEITVRAKTRSGVLVSVTKEEITSYSPVSQRLTMTRLSEASAANIGEYLNRKLVEFFKIR